jgi:hypothetical protein
MRIVKKLPANELESVDIFQLNEHDLLAPESLREPGFDTQSHRLGSGVE